ncbi:MAG: RNase adapter RapZ [Nitrospirae bacterium]|nr:RNase adapter RapZ [Candidatus Troglogloeales bacterium]
MKKVNLVIISGLSGAGKSAAIKCFEDIGFFCVDNLPPPLLPKFVELCGAPGSEVSRVALGIDIRNRDFLDAFLGIYESLCKEGHPIELLFIEAQDEILIRRFSESRRPHPLGRGHAIAAGIMEERKKLSALRDIAHQIIDTSELSPLELKRIIIRAYIKAEEGSPLHISLISFGFKFGVPYGLDMLFDVRFLKNPYFQRELRFQTGDDKPVQEFIYALKESEQFMEKLTNLLDFMVPLYEHEGKSYLTLGIGCTGGRHRSVAIVNLLKEVLQQNGRELSCLHRDIYRPPSG